MYCNGKTEGEATLLLRGWLEDESNNAKQANKCQNGVDFYPFSHYELPRNAANSADRQSAPALTAWEQAMAKRLDIAHVHATANGATADLLALSALTAPVLGERALRPGDEVITVALDAMPLITPILQLGAVPVAVDVSPAHYNINAALLEQALSPATRAVMLSHTAGYPFDLKTVRNFCNDYELWLIEDCREAFGAAYDFDGTRYAAGTVGDIGCGALPPLSPDGESIGFVCTRDDTLTLILQGMRDGAAIDGDLAAPFESCVDFRCDATQATAALAALVDLDEHLQTRKKAANGVEKALSSLCALPMPLPNTHPAPSALPVLFESTEACEKAAAALAAAGIPCKPFQNVFSHTVWAHFMHRIPSALMETEQISACALSLPLPRNEAALTLLLDTVREALQ